MSEIVVAIHQPNFFPWLGYFDKIARCNVFVALDDVQLSRSGAGSWSNRVKLLVGGRNWWATAPLRRESGPQLICDVCFDETAPWRRKLLASIQGSYGKATHYREVAPVLEELVAHPESNLAAYNLCAIRAIAGLIGIDQQKIVRSSELAHEGAGTELLISLTKEVGGDTYLCGGGAGGYQEDKLFEAHGVTLRYQNFQLADYPQRGATSDFVAGLSIIDALLNTGVVGTRALLGLGNEDG